MKTHGYSGSPTYVCWMKMKSRCYNVNAINYARYGGAGIEVCERWQKFEAFLEDMGERPSMGHSIDRKDSTKGYYPGNCKWSTDTEQSRNRSCVRLLTVGGATLSPAAWAKIQGVSVKTIYNRMQLGWSDNDVVLGRSPRSCLLTINGLTKTATEWSKQTGTSTATICKRLRRGWNHEDAVFGRSGKAIA